MDILFFFLLFALFFSVTFLGHWIDNKYNVQVMRWMNCEVSSPFKTNNNDTTPKKELSNTSDDLRARVATLEKIVTDSSWELNQKLNKL